MDNFPIRHTWRRIIPACIFTFAMSIGLVGQQRVVALADPAPSVVTDLNSSLFELTRVAAVTDRDLEKAHVGGGKTRWLTIWRRQSAHKAQIAASLRRNLRLAVPNLVQDVQRSHGSITTTFKLYNDMSLVCESLDNLVSSAGQPNKRRYPALSSDLSDLDRLREGFSAHIQQAAAFMENANPELVSAVGRPKKIIIDDEVPEKRTRRKHTSPQ